jgi:hypothetical protein
MRRALVLAVLALACAGAGARAAGLQASAALTRALAGGGRGEATLRYLTTGASGVPRAVHATLALEPPDRARMDVSASGEKLVARADGGEWLQPATRQLLRFPARRSAAALRWWRVLLATDGTARERRIADGRFVVTLLGEHGAAVDSAEVWLDPHGLPTRLVVPAGDPEAAVYRLGSWRFSRARGEAGFRLAAPAGFEVVDTP